MKEQYSNQNISSSLPCQQKLGSPHRRFKPWRNWSINSPNPTTTPWNCSSTTWGGMSPSTHTTRGVTQNTRSHRTFWGPLNHLSGRISSTLIVFLPKVMSKTVYTINWPFLCFPLSVCFNYLSFTDVCWLVSESLCKLFTNVCRVKSCAPFTNDSQAENEKDLLSIWALISHLLFIYVYVVKLQRTDIYTI